MIRRRSCASCVKRQASDRPSLIACKTTIGFGAPTKAGTSKAHGEALGAAEIAGARDNLHWPYAPFVVPDEILDAWRAVGRRGALRRTSLARAPGTRPAAKRAEFERRIAGELPASFSETIDALQAQARRGRAGDRHPQSGRGGAQGHRARCARARRRLGRSDALEQHQGRGDAATSRPTICPAATCITASASTAWRRHATAWRCMAASFPSGASFLVFTDYCRPALRLAALMRMRVYVFTHDSIGLGEDGPTHQPVEHLAALRAMPNMLVLRPGRFRRDGRVLADRARGATFALDPGADAPEPAGPAPHACRGESCARGAYEISPADGEAEVSIFASGSEVSLAVAAQKLLRARRWRRASSPCLAWSCSSQQHEAYRRAVIGAAKVRVAVEAAVRQGWDAIIGDGPSSA